MDADDEHLPDEQILAGLRGDEHARLTALDRAMNQYTFRVGGLARKYLGDSDAHDVVDVVDQTFQALWEDHMRIEGSLWAWLAGVTANKAITLVRKRIRRDRREPVRLQDQTESGLSLEDSGELMLIAEGIEDPWSGMIFDEYIEQFALCVKKLPPTQKAVGLVMLEAAKQSGELPDNDHILKEVRRLVGDPNFSLEAVKSAKKQVLAKLRPTIAHSEKREQRTSAV